MTSGTATLETALFKTPQVVCYFMIFAKIVSLLQKMVLKVPYISLVNLIVGKEIVKELVADSMTVNNIRNELTALLNDTQEKKDMLMGYEEMSRKLGSAGAPQHAASLMIKLLSGK